VRYQPLLVAMLIFFILRPIANTLFAFSLPLNPLRYLVMIAALYAIRDRRLLFASALGLAVGDAVLRSLYESGQSALLLNLSHGLGFAATLLVGFAILADIFKGGEVTLDIIIGAVCMYLMIGVIWAFLYYFLELLVPGSILAHPTAFFGHRIEDERFAELLYVSIGALSSVGFLTNVSAAPLLGQLAVVEAVGGQLYLAVLIARLVGSQKA
jgi:hypothetical protein